MGHTPVTKYVVCFVVTLQLSIAIYLRNTHPLSWRFIAWAYIIGGTANHNLFLAIHEICHNLAFRGIVANKLLSAFANLPIGIPYSAMFKVSRFDLWENTCLIVVYRNTIWSITGTWGRMVSTPTCLLD